MPKSIITEGKTSTEAIEKGLKELKATKNQVEIKVLEEKKKSFFNILDPHIVKVEITLKEEFNKKESNHKESFNKENDYKKVPYEKISNINDEFNEENVNIAMQDVKAFLEIFLKKISESIKFKVTKELNILNVEITGDESARLIGYRGEALNGLQVILSNIANKEKECNIKVILDVGDYKETRKKTLEELSSKIERTVARTGKSITLEPMTAYERKIIHTKLQNSETVKTYSIGEADRRRVVIAKK